MEKIPFRSPCGNYRKPENLVMASKDQFPKRPPTRFKLTKALARKIEEAKEAGESVMVCGYSRRHPWPDPDTLTLCAWFVDSEALAEALKISGIMAEDKRTGTQESKTGGQ